MVRNMLDGPILNNISIQRKVYTEDEPDEFNDHTFCEVSNCYIRGGHLGLAAATPDLTDNVG